MGGGKTRRTWHHSVMSTTPDQAKTPSRVVVKGTSGAGKTTFGAELARRLGLS